MSGVSTKGVVNKKGDFDAQMKDSSAKGDKQEIQQPAILKGSSQSKRWDDANMAEEEVAVSPFCIDTSKVESAS